MMYEFEMIGSIVGKARPRMNTRTGRAYTPTNTKLYEYSLRQWFIREYPYFKPLENRVKVSIIAYFDIPKSTSKKKQKQMLDCEIFPTVKPDTDNIAKSILDSLNGIAYLDDKQVVKLEVEKYYATSANVAVMIEELEG